MFLCSFCFFHFPSQCCRLCPRLTVARAALLPLPTQENQLVVTSCCQRRRRRDVSSCCHRKVARWTSECKGLAKKRLRGCHRATDSALVTAAEPAVLWRYGGAGLLVLVSAYSQSGYRLVGETFSLLVRLFSCFY